MATRRSELFQDRLHGRLVVAGGGHGERADDFEALARPAALAARNGPSSACFASECICRATRRPRLACSGSA